MTFLSLAPDALGTQQSAGIKAALALAAVPQPVAEPLDWQQNICEIGLLARAASAKPKGTARSMRIDT